MENYVVCDENEVYSALNKINNQINFLLRMMLEYNCIMYQVKTDALNDLKIKAAIEALNTEYLVLNASLLQIIEELDDTVRRYLFAMNLHDKFEFPYNMIYMLSSILSPLI